MMHCGIYASGLYSYSHVTTRLSTLHRHTLLQSEAGTKRSMALLDVACEQVLPARNESLQQSWG